MQTLLKTKIGTFLVVSSVLAVWTLLAAQPVQAHTDALPRLSCSSSILPDDEFLDDVTQDITGGTASGDTANFNNISALTTKKGNDDITDPDSGDSDYYYAKITVPALTAGELMVSDSGDGPSDAILCGRQGGDVTSKTDYSDHDKAEDARDDALKAAMEADDDAAKPDASDSTLMRDLRAAANELGDAADALRKVGTDAADTAADTAEADEMTADDAADADDADEASLQRALEAAADDLEAAADVLGDAADDDHMGFDISALISSGDEEYVVVVAVPADTTDAPSLEITFKGVMSTDATDPDGGSFTQNNQRITRTLKTTTNDPGLLTVKTTGSAVDTEGTLEDSNNATVAMDEGSSGNFEIVSPVKADGTYDVHVEGQTRSERGDFDLKVEFGVAIDLGTAATSNDGTTRDEMLEPGRADYFFFNATALRFLTVQTQKHVDVTTETDTTGTLFSTNGMITTDTNSGTDNNFLLRTPISIRDYIVEVKGARSSTEGEYRLVMSSQAATTRGSAPNMLTATPATDQTLTAAAVVPYSIAVTAPGTLQVKTTGSTDTVGVLYGPNGQQIAADDDSGDGMNFLITEYVEAGQHIVTIEGQTRTTTGDYTLVVNFVEGADIDVGTVPGSSDERVVELERQVRELEDDLDECPVPVVTDARGVLENPSGGGVRSGIGVISGWVCAAEEVEVRIFRAPNVHLRTLAVAYGTSRPDVPQNSSCNNAHAGFGMTYNFNHLPEGEYTIRAFADDDQIGIDETFEVVHLVASFPDANRFLEDLDGMCRVENFPGTGETTRLEWEQSLQNFVITGVR